MTLLTLPNPILLEEICAQLPLACLSQLCAVNRRFHDIGSNDRLWQLKTMQEYSTQAEQKPSDQTWKQYYRYLINIIRKISVTIVVNYKYIALGQIDLNRNSTISSLTTEILNLAKHKGNHIDDYMIVFCQDMLDSVRENFLYLHLITSYSTANNSKTFGPIKDIDYTIIIIDPEVIEHNSSDHGFINGASYVQYIETSKNKY